jgi:hypothetical protein
LQIKHLSPPPARSEHRSTENGANRSEAGTMAMIETCGTLVACYPIHALLFGVVLRALGLAVRKEMRRSAPRLATPARALSPAA